MQEAKLQQWQTKQRSPSTVDTFAAASGYQQAAAEAMARVRARLMGFTDDETYGTEQQGMQDSGGSSHAPSDASQHTAADSTSLSPAAQLILQELLMRCSCREERATVLPEAMMPPGLQVRGSQIHLVGMSATVHTCSSLQTPFPCSTTLDKMDPLLSVVVPTNAGALNGSNCMVLSCSGS